ncbi:MAG: hypothetical protein K5644_02335, partial [Lachnospiraceae bacterium]|nr:hypothetical protein [Lachnospiraceae bacterium]
FAELVLIIANIIYYIRILKKDKAEYKKDVGLFYMSVEQSEAVEASKALREYAKKNGINKDLAMKIALCLEEMVVSVEPARADHKVSAQIMIRFLEEEAIFTMLDDAKCIELNQDKEHGPIITDSYNLLKKLAEITEYQYVLNLNYSVFIFEHWKEAATA